ncbi:Armadillo-type fold [Arabidopsis thaliana x Arabidopsis arenosa]|uniref:Armadillo-type fold n=1 Tax=Arabidopsis thaliana x Arabidopsis arenosa TaxID=1240361 RepID=A0A8T1Y5I6_9BRAS|nr:Armadillo-type fold [Arabidopsis thaliana x Arabidopsis arenosa]
MFLNCLYDLCSVKKECHHLLLTRTIADVVKRLKDSSMDSGVRDACVDTIGALSRIYLNSDDAVVALFVEPLFEAMRERRKGVQSGAAMCMAKMVQSAATPPISSFQKLCPRICELLSNPCFLAEASLLLVVSSLSQVGAIAPQSLDSLLERIHACLANFTLAVLENRVFEKIKAVRESVTEALQLWKNISGKCVDGASDDSKIASGDLLGSEKNGKQRSDLAHLMKKESSDGSTLSPDSPTKEKLGLADTEAVVILKNKARASSNTAYFQRLVKSHSVSEGSSSSNRGHWLAVQKQLLELERKQNYFMYLLQEFVGVSHDSTVAVEGKATDLSISSGHKGNLTAGSGKNDNNVANYPTGKYNGRAPGDRGSQPDGATRDMANAAWRNGQAEPRRSPRSSEQHENEQMGNWWTCGESEGYGGYGTVRYVWYKLDRREIELMSISDIESAYEEVFGTNDQSLIISLMKKTGPIFDRLLSIKIAHKIIKFISQLLEDHNYYDMCVDWIRELQEKLERSGIARFGDPRKLKRKILYNLQQAGQRRMDPSIPKLIVKLADSWNVDIQIKVTL